MGHRGALRLAYFVHPLRAASAYPVGPVVGRLVRRGAIPSAIASALHCADYMLRCALPTRAHFHIPALSQCYPFALTFIRKLL